MQRTQLVIAFLLGTVAALLLVLVTTNGRGAFPEAFAQTAANNRLVVVGGNGGSQQNRDTIFVIDSETKRLAVYQLNNGKLSLMAVRNLTYDMEFEEYANPKAGGPQDPTVRAVQEHVKKK
jgi:hypothetical protein